MLSEVTFDGTRDIDVDVDIKPGSDQNPINLKSKGVIPVAILTTDDFDAADVDGSTVTFAGASPAHGSGHLEDVDGDGDLDWIGHFRTQETNISDGETEASVAGQTTGGINLKGSDGISITKGSKKGKAGKPTLSNHPNPFNPATTIHYSLEEATDVRLTIYNVLGQPVRTLVQGGQGSGVHHVVWDGRDALGHQVTSGLYLYRLEAGQQVAVRKMILAK
jgi:hypothetical protein